MSSISNNPKKKYKRLRYFFLEREGHGPLLHRSLFINRGADQIVTWCYPLKQRIVYTYSDVKKRKETAFTTKQTGEMIMRSRIQLERAILNGNIEMPQYSYSLDERMRKKQYWWHESNIMEAHAYFSTVHRGRPRKDGQITPQRLPTPRELRAQIRQDEILYVRTEDGSFIPSWKASNFD